MLGSRGEPHLPTTTAASMFFPCSRMFGWRRSVARMLSGMPVPWNRKIGDNGVWFVASGVGAVLRGCPRFPLMVPIQPSWLPWAWNDLSPLGHAHRVRMAPYVSAFSWAGLRIVVWRCRGLPASIHDLDHVRTGQRAAGGVVDGGRCWWDGPCFLPVPSWARSRASTTLVVDHLSHG